jgi:hypothetical protein
MSIFISEVLCKELNHKFPGTSLVSKVRHKTNYCIMKSYTLFNWTFPLLWIESEEYTFSMDIMETSIKKGEKQLSSVVEFISDLEVCYYRSVKQEVYADNIRKSASCSVSS